MSVITRRGFFKGAAAGTAALGALSTSRAAAEDVHAFFRGLVGTELGAATVESAELHLGAVAVLMRDADGQRFQVDVLRTDATQEGVRDSAGLSFFLANRGNGHAPSHESHGVSLIELATWCSTRASGAPAPELLTWTERASAHPRGAFLVC
ncbi:MAG: hypothetical protein ACI9KE_000054 [Polyangiales bacterium]|jgi:hypothetical protein